MAQTRLERPQSLHLAARAAQSSGQALVVMTTLRGCPYCDLVRGGYLLPMQRRGEIVAVELDIADEAPIEGFDARATTPKALSRAWKNRVAPTLYFFDAQGREIADRLEGIAVPDFFADYLNQRLSRARAALARRAVPVQ